jgi:hypothetical protein
MGSGFVLEAFEERALGPDLELTVECPVQHLVSQDLTASDHVLETVAGFGILAGRGLIGLETLIFIMVNRKGYKCRVSVPN